MDDQQDGIGVDRQNYQHTSGKSSRSFEDPNKLVNDEGRHVSSDLSHERSKLDILYTLSVLF